MTQLRTLLLGALCMLAVAGCQSNRVVTDYDPAADFTSYRQYGWLEERSGASDQFSPLLEKRVREAVTTELRAQGFTEAAGNPPDFLVRYYVGSSAQVSEPNMRGSVGLGSFGRGLGMGVSLGFPLGGTRVRQEATVLIDFMHPETRSLTWRGQEEISISGDDPAKISEQISRSVAAILARFPPDQQR